MAQKVRELEVSGSLREFKLYCFTLVIVIGEDFVDIYSCMDECYLSIDDEVDPDLGFAISDSSSHEEGDSVEKFVGASSSGETLLGANIIEETDKMAITDQTLRLGDFLFDELQTEERNRLQQYEQPPNPGPSAPNLRIVQLFKKTIKILGKTCPHPFLPEDFRNRILSGFLFLVQDTGIGEVDDISMEDFEDIADALKSCEAQYPRFRLEGTVCSMKTIVSIFDLSFSVSCYGSQYKSNFHYFRPLK